MSPSQSHTLPIETTCLACQSPVEKSAKFCGSCGQSMTAARAEASQPPLVPRHIQAVPTFARVSGRGSQGAIKELQEEAGKLLVLLVRERLFLYMHWTIFISVNLVGFWMAAHLYVGYIADEMTKLMMATTPLLYINCVALCCLVPIRGTKKEIARLKEKLNYIKFQIEYNHLL